MEEIAGDPNQELDRHQVSDRGHSLGLVMLMFTPYLRVAASVVYFAAIARNLKYTLFTLFVFAVLSYSLFLR